MFFGGRCGGGPSPRPSPQGEREKKKERVARWWGFVPAGKEGGFVRSSLELQRALVVALEGDGVLRARGLRLFDGPPADARPPYLSVGQDVVTDRGWKGGGGLEHRFGVTLWAAREGFAAAKEVLAEVERVVLAMPARIGTARITHLRLLRASVRRSPRSWTQGVLEFRALTVREN